MQHSPYIDCHLHSQISDGALNSSAVVDKCINEGIGIIAFQEHNKINPSRANLQKMHPDMILIPGCEFSSTYVDSTGKSHEIHITSYGIDEENQAINEVLAQNRFDRTPYIETILNLLQKDNIFLSQDEIRTELQLPPEKSLGRNQIARILVKRGYAEDVDHAYFRWLGPHGLRRAYLPKPVEFAPLTMVIEAIFSSGGVPCLAHPLRYSMSLIDIDHLIHTFGHLTGSKGAIESSYGPFTQAERKLLYEMGEKNGIHLHAPGSDYHGHGQRESDRLNYHFKAVDFFPLLHALGV